LTAGRRVAGAHEAAAAVSTIDVPVPGAPYQVTVGPGVLDQLGRFAGLTGRRVAIVSSGVAHDLYAERAAAALDGYEVHQVTIPDGEDAKTLSTLGTVYHRLAAVNLRRGDAVVALGGGVVGDLAGFAAATWNRGVACVQVPTTLLAQVDAAVGGKTGVNLPEGKNLVGAFHQPVAVVADTATLATLPQRERIAGLGEVAKYGFIADPVVLELLETRPDAAVAGDPAVLTEIVRRSIAVKARVVAADEREAGERALLNYGHTIGHAIETVTDYARYRHGEAVAIGLVAAARLGERLGVSETGLADRTAALLSRLGLPTGGVRVDPSAVWDVLARDKKATPQTDGESRRDPGHGVRFVLCRTPGDAYLADPPDRRHVDEVLRTLA
jgi:3-dehydroquinate synthase